MMNLSDERITNTPSRLVAIVVTFNRLEKLKTTLDRLCSTPDPMLSAIVVVDNASTDGTGAWLSDQNDPRLDLILSPANVGGAGGFADGMRRALDKHSPDWLVLMDDDGRPYDGALEAFHSLNADAQGWAAVAAAVYYPNGEICDMNRPSKNPFWHLAVFVKTLLGLGSRDGFHIDHSTYAKNTPTPIDITSFVGFFVSAPTARQIPLPNPDLFIYGDDGLYSLAVSKTGRKMVFHPAVRFEHDCDTFHRDAQKRFTPIWKIYYYHRNLLMLYRQAAGWWTVPLLFIVLPKWALKVLNHKDVARQFFKLMGMAVKDGLRGHLGRTHDEIMAVARDTK